MQLNGQAAIVTGGASGLGGATAAFLAQAGAKVTIFDMNAELGEEKATAIGGKFLRVDVTDERIEFFSRAKREKLSFGHNEARVRSINPWDRHQNFERSGIHVHFELHQFLLLVIIW